MLSKCEIEWNIEKIWSPLFESDIQSLDLTAESQEPLALASIILLDYDLPYEGAAVCENILNLDKIKPRTSNTEFIFYFIYIYFTDASP